MSDLLVLDRQYQGTGRAALALVGVLPGRGAGAVDGAQPGRYPSLDQSEVPAIKGKARLLPGPSGALDGRWPPQYGAACCP